MCRRALEASCEHLEAKGKTLEDKIDSLEEMGEITTYLKDMAHKIRLTGNRGAHDLPPVLLPVITEDSGHCTPC